MPLPPLPLDMHTLDGNYCWTVNTMAMDKLLNERARQRIVVGISGATGIIYGVRALQILRELGIETHLVVSRAGELTRAYETALSRSDLHALADVVHPIADVGRVCQWLLPNTWYADRALFSTHLG